MARDDKTAITFTYRPALTWVVISGRCTRTDSRLASVARPRVQRVLAVTTEVTADPREAYTMTTTAKRMAEQRRDWTLLPDGRLTGAESTTQADPYAGWRTALRVGASVAAVAAPLLTPVAPPLAAGALALSAAGSAGSAVLRGGTRGFAPELSGFDAGFPEAEFAPRELGRVEEEVVVAAEPDWAALGIAEEYPGEHPEAARALAAWRTVIRDLVAAHLAAAEKAVTDPTEGRRAQAVLTATLAATRAEAAPAEAAYAAWVASASTTVTEDVVVRFPVDALPTAAVVKAWADAGGAGGASSAPSNTTSAEDWRATARTHRIVVSVDPEPLSASSDNTPADNTPADSAPPQLNRPDALHYRPPRPVTVRVWTLDGVDDGKPAPLTLTRTFHVLATWPGNEQTLATPDAAKGLSATFGDDGALRSLSAELVDARLARARALAELPDAVKAGAETGEAIWKVFAPPTLQQQAAEREAAAKLGLLPSTPDPLAEERRRLEREELEARIRIAEQLGRSSSDVATVVHINN